MAELLVPGKIRVLGQTFTVRVIGRDETFYRGADKDVLGYTDTALQKIELLGPDEMSAAQAADTLLHETLHAMTSLFQILPDASETEEEAIIKALTPALMHTLRDNPKLVAAILTDFDSDEPAHEHVD